LLGVSDLFDALTFLVVYLVLAASGQSTQSGRLYLALLPATAIAQVAIYLLRLAQPATSRRLRGGGGDAGRARALMLLRLGERLGLGFAVGFTGLLLVPVARAWLRSAGLVPLGALVGVALVLFLTVMYGGFLLENTNDRALAATSSGALSGLLAAIGLAAVLVPALGAVGGLATLALAMPVKAYAIRRVMAGSRRSRPVPAEPVIERPVPEGME
jgi:hypothetical protein